MPKQLTVVQFPPLFFCYTEKLHIDIMPFCQLVGNLILPHFSPFPVSKICWKSMKCNSEKRIAACTTTGYSDRKTWLVQKEDPAGTGRASSHWVLRAGDSLLSLSCRFFLCSGFILQPYRSILPIKPYSEVHNSNKLVTSNCSVPVDFKISGESGGKSWLNVQLLETSTNNNKSFKLMRVYDT